MPPFTRNALYGDSNNSLVQNVLFAGEQSATADAQKLAEAKQLHASGVPKRDVWKSTGWWLGDSDQKWRYEIPDTDAALSAQANKIYGPETKPGTGTFVPGKPSPGVPLPNFLTHDQFYQAYPGARTGDNSGTNALMHYSKERGQEGEAFTKPAISQVPPAERDPNSFGPQQYIELTAPNRNIARHVGLHEIQHYIQNLEGFTQGTDPALAGKDGYLNNAGEIEARRVQARSFMTPQQLMSIPPWETDPYTHPLQRKR